MSVLAGKFKKYLMSESVSMDELGPRIDRLVNGGLDGAIAAADIPIDPDASIPSVRGEGRIDTLLRNKRNLIYVRLSDGTEANFSHDEWRRIDGEPEIGKTMTIHFQRHPLDRSAQRSRIDHVTVR